MKGFLFKKYAEKLQQRIQKSFICLLRILKQTNMKHKLKKILLLYIISGTLFVSCSLEEDYATKKRYEEKMKISHVSFGELLKNKKFSTAYSKVLQQQSLTNKTVME